MLIFAATHVALSCGVRPDCEWKCTLKGVGLLKYVNETLPLHRQHAARQRLAQGACDKFWSLRQTNRLTASNLI